MTKYHISKPILLLSITVLMLLSIHHVQSQDTGNHAIVGTWLFNSQLSFAKMNKKANDQLTKKPQLRTKIQSTYTGKQITFLANGSYSQILSNGKKAIGQWSVQGSNLIIADPAGLKYNYTYKFTGNNLVITSIGNTTSVVPNQYFTKIKN